MIVCVVAAITGPSPDIIERWPPEKAVAYFVKALEVRNLLGRSA